MENKLINKIKELLSRIEIDKRIKPFIKLFFIGKTKTDTINETQLENEICLLCSKIQNVEFSSADNMVAAYSSKGNVLTISKKLISEGKWDELILPVFMKLESALNPSSKREYTNHIENFISAGRIATAISAPISDRLYRLYKISEDMYGEKGFKPEDLDENRGLMFLFKDTNITLNKMIVTGKDVWQSEYDKTFFSSKVNKNALDTYSYNSNPELSIRLANAAEWEEPQLSDEYMIHKVQELVNDKKGWDSGVKKYVAQYFLRSQKIHNWSYDEFLERLNQVRLKIDTIRLDNLESNTIGGTASDNSIVLNSRFFKDSGKNNVKSLKSMLFHEMGHVTDENEREGIFTRHRIQEANLGTGRFYEWANTIFEGLVDGEKFYTNNDALQVKLPGYQPLAPIGSMLCAALGVSEVEFARIKDKGKEHELDFWKEKIGESFETSSEISERIKDLFDRYELSVFTPAKKRTENQNVVNQMYNECISLMKLRIENEIQSGNINDEDEYKKHQMFYLRKINWNYNVSVRNNRRRFQSIPIVHDIGFCTDDLSKNDMKRLANEQLRTINFGFNNEELNTSLSIKRAGFIGNLRNFFRPFIGTNNQNSQAQKQNETRENDYQK